MKKIAFFMIIFPLAFPLFLGAQEKSIFVIESYHAEYPWDMSYKKGLESVLGSEYKIIYFEMDTKRLPVSEHAKRAEQAFEMYKKIMPALVILGDDNALKYLEPKLSKTSTPVVFLGINNNPREYNIESYENFTGVLERPLMKRSIIYLNQILQPEPEKILLLFDSGTTSKASFRSKFKDKSSVMLSGIKTDLKLIGKLDVWKETVLNAKKNGYDAIMVGLYHTIIDSEGRHVDASEVIQWTSQNTPVPPFCFWDFAVGYDKTVGGLVLFGHTQGEAAAKIALRVLNGENPKNISPVVGKKGRLFFSKYQLGKWNITLPLNMVNSVEFTK